MEVLNENGEPNRIFYHIWTNTPLSIARHFGSCTFNGKEYKLDYENCESVEIDGEIHYLPDLIEI